MLAVAADPEGGRQNWSSHTCASSFAPAGSLACPAGSHGSKPVSEWSRIPEQRWLSSWLSPFATPATTTAGWISACAAAAAGMGAAAAGLSACSARLRQLCQVLAKRAVWQVTCHFIDRCVSMIICHPFVQQQQQYSAPAQQGCSRFIKSLLSALFGKRCTK